MELYLANSVFAREGFDYLKTVEAGAIHGFHGVQFYLDDVKMRMTDVLRETADAARDLGLEIIVHLPDEAGEACLRAACDLMRFQERKRAVIHFSPQAPVPSCPGLGIGLENAVQGYQREYYRVLLHAVGRTGTFFAFDIPRLFGGGAFPGEDVYGFIEGLISRMGPLDFLHLIDQASPGSDRALWVPLGKGLMAPILGAVRGFQGGIVFEYEDLGMAIESLNAIA